MRNIQSSSNPRIQAIKQLQRSRRKSHIILEGKKLTQEAILSGLKINEAFVVSEFWAQERTWLEPMEQRGTVLWIVTPKLLKSISSVETPEGIIAVAKRPAMLGDMRLTEFGLLLFSIRDPGNFGAILRTAEACGASMVAYSSDCADPYLPKVSRGSMGSLFRVPLLEVAKPFDFVQEKMQQRITVYGLSVNAQKTIDDVTPGFPFLLCIGSESHGLPSDLPVTETISIPMKGKVESLNAAVATAIVLYFFTRGRSGRSG
jgi:TrmH family RNA methyltransferase